jgi:hypothetical protein
MVFITFCAGTAAPSAASGTFSAFQTGTSGVSALVGTWKGSMGAVPAVELTIREAAGKLSGSMVMFVIGRSATGEPMVTSKEDVTMLDPQWKDDHLTFLIKSKQGETLRFAVKPTGADRAELQRADDDNSGDDPIVLRRGKV